MIRLISRCWRHSAAILTLLLCLALACGAEQVLVNGDFELAGGFGGQDYGPGWAANSGLEVIGAGWHQGVSPYSGSKALGAAGNSDRASGQLVQTITVAPGNYTVTLTAQGWLYTPPGNPWEQSMVEIRLMVDGLPARCYRLQTVINHPGSAWLPMEIQFTGPVTQSVQVQAFVQGNGLGGGWGVAVIDALSLDVSPAQPAKQNYMVNGNYEQSGPAGSSTISPGWFNALGWEVIEAGWYGPEACACSPYGGSKAAGIYTVGGVHSASMGQYIPLTPGYHVLSFRGAYYLWDVLNHGGDESTAEVTLIVDSQQVQSQKFIANHNDARPGIWNQIDWTWSGNVNQSASVIIKGEVRGQSGGSWGLLAVDEWSLSEFDITNPVGISITDDGVFTGSQTQLHATWTGNDPQSGIRAYEYSIGTFPLQTNVVNWTNAGLATEVTHYGLSLNVGQKYYWNVRVKNGQGNYGATVTTDGITVITPPTMTIAEAKQQPDGTIVRVADKVVSVRAGKSYWLQEQSSPSGVRAKGEQLYNVVPFSRMTITGVMATQNGERVIQHASAASVGGFSVPKPIRINTRDLGGAEFVPVLPGVAAGMGANNLGLLVMLTGRVTAIGPDYYYVDDGFGYLDGTTTSGTPNVGVRVISAPVGIAVGDLIKVQGTSSTVMGPDAQPHRAIVGMLNPTKLL